MVITFHYQVEEYEPLLVLAILVLRFELIATLIRAFTVVHADLLEYFLQKRL